MLLRNGQPSWRPWWWWLRAPFALALFLSTAAGAIGFPSNLRVYWRCARWGGGGCDPLIGTVPDVSALISSWDWWRAINVVGMLIALAFLVWSRLPDRAMLRNLGGKAITPEGVNRTEVIFRDVNEEREWTFGEVYDLVDAEKERLRTQRPEVWSAYRGRLFRNVLPPAQSAVDQAKTFVHDGVEWKLRPEFFDCNQSIDHLDREIVDTCILGPFCPVCGRNLWVPDKYGEYTIDKYEPICPKCDYHCPPVRGGFLVESVKRDAFMEAQRLISQGVPLPTKSPHISLWLEVKLERDQRNLAELGSMLEEGISLRDSLRHEVRHEQLPGRIGPASPMEPIAYHGYEMDAWSGQVVGKLKTMKDSSFATYFSGCVEISQPQERAECYLKRLSAIIEQLRAKVRS